MCDLAALPTLIGIGSKLIGAAGQAQTAAATRASAEAAFRDEKIALARKGIQGDQAAAKTILQADRQARGADALARVSAGEAGVSGTSVDLLLADIERERLEFKTGVESGREDERLQIRDEVKAAKARRDSRINGSPGVDPLSVGLQIGSEGVKAGTDWIGRQPKPEGGRR